MTITNVEISSPIIPLENSAIRIDKAEFTAMFPKSTVLSKRFPLFLNGNIFLAYLARRASCSLS